MDVQQMKLQPSAILANDPDAISEDEREVDRTTSSQSTPRQNSEMGTYSQCHHCSKRLETIAGLQVQLEALHDELDGLVQCRKRQEEQIHNLQRQLSYTQESNDERTRQLEFLEAQNRDCQQANQRLMSSLEIVERELAKVNAQVCALQDYVNQPTQSNEVKRLIHALQEQLDKQVSLNKYLSEEVMRVANNNQQPSLCHRYEGLMLRPLRAAIDAYSQHRLLTSVWLATFYFLFCCWCGVFTPVTSLSQVTSFWLQCAESTNIVPT